jgi:hypothetical protein
LKRREDCDGSGRRGKTGRWNYVGITDGYVKRGESMFSRLQWILEVYERKALLYLTSEHTRFLSSHFCILVTEFAKFEAERSS